MLDELGRKRGARFKQIAVECSDKKFGRARPFGSELAEAVAAASDRRYASKYETPRQRRPPAAHSVSSGSRVRLCHLRAAKVQ
jgi:hypothetical protein